MKKALLALVLVATPAFADVTYLGTWDCGQWNEAARTRADGMRKAYLFWISGFLSGVAVTKNLDSMLDGISEAAIASWTDNYCKSKPLNKLVNAADTLADELILRDASRKKK